MLLLLAGFLLSLVTGFSVPLALTPTNLHEAPPAPSVATDEPRTPARGVTTFEDGMSFTIDYPSDFTAIPGLGRDVDPNDPVSSASFRSPDGSVEFYVYSPLWNGEPTDFSPPEGTKVVEERTGDRVVRRATWKMPGGMTRSFEDTEYPSTNTRRTFGIAYRDRASYEKWRPAYLAFKASLRQFAD